MAGKFSVYTANLILNKVLKAVDFTPPASYWVALFTAADDTALRANTVASAAEVVNTYGYTRQQIRAGTSINFTTSTVGASDTDSQILWSAATGSWGTVTYIALMDSVTIGAGNVILYGSLVTPKPVDNGDIVRVNTGLFDITL